MRADDHLRAAARPLGLCLAAGRSLVPVQRELGPSGGSGHAVYGEDIHARDVTCLAFVLFETRQVRAGSCLCCVPSDSRLGGMSQISGKDSRAAWEVGGPGPVSDNADRLPALSLALLGPVCSLLGVPPLTGLPSALCDIDLR